MILRPDAPLRVSLRWSATERRTVGRLAVASGRPRRVFFEFDPDFLRSPLPISPVRLAPRAGVLEGPAQPFAGLFGVFDDSLPDGWGRLLIHRRARRAGIDPQALTPLDMLACLGNWAMGALVYEPEIDSPAPEGAIDLDVVADETRRILAGAPDDLFPELLRLGGSPAGARPKALVCRRADDGLLIHGAPVAPPGYDHWMVKFRGKDDPKDIGPIEQAYALMARDAGLDVPDSQLLPSGGTGPGYFATRRFDRVGTADRVHLHSAAGLLHADFRLPSLDYTDLLRLTLHVTRDHRAAVEMFRRVAFNVFAHNRDDHARQFSFLMTPDGAWRLAPAYDLTFSAGPGGEHATSVAGEGLHPATGHLLALAKLIDLKPSDATAIIDRVRHAVAGWQACADAAGVGRAWRTRIATAIVARRPAS